jgi:hypothetical protein
VQYAVAGDDGGSRRILDPTERGDDSDARQTPRYTAGDDDMESTTCVSWMMSGGGDME